MVHMRKGWGGCVREREKRVTGRTVWVDSFPAYLLGCRLAALRNICDIFLGSFSPLHFHFTSLFISSSLLLHPVFAASLFGHRFLLWTLSSLFLPFHPFVEDLFLVLLLPLPLSVCQSELPFISFFFPPSTLSEWLCSPEVDLTGGCVFRLVWTRFLFMLQSMKTAEWELLHHLSSSQQQPMLKRWQSF